MVEKALAFVRVARGLISAGYNHGSSSQVAPKVMRKTNMPTTAPFKSFLSANVTCVRDWVADQR